MPAFNFLYTTDKVKSAYAIDCVPGGSQNNNLVYNPGMLTNNTYNGDGSNPFTHGYVDYWASAFGTPNFDVPPFAGINIAAGGSTYAGGVVYSEGVLGKLVPLIQGHEYSLSFYLNTLTNSTSPNQLHDYNVYLIHCSEVSTYFPDPNTNPQIPLPPIPTNRQRIFCETNSGNTNWHQISVCFTADADYDMLLVYPAITPNPSTPEYTYYIGFAYPEIISKSNFGISVSIPDQTPCIKALTTSYVVNNATYQWFLNGNLFSTAASPQIDASTQYGTISVQVTLPNSGTNTTCGTQNCVLTASINIPACTPPWPKVFGYTANPYGSSQPSALVQDNSNNLFISLYQYDFSLNYNQNGGTYPTSPGVSTVHYNKTTGVTNWIAPNERILFALNSGIVQLNINTTFTNTSVINTVYRNAVTGALVSGPASIPSNQMILAEDNGAYITRDNSSLFVHSAAGVMSAPIAFPGSAPGFSFYRWKYNPATKHLFVEYSGMFAVYLLNNNTLSLINNPNTACINGGGFNVNSLDEAFYTTYVNGSYCIYKYTYSNNSCTQVLSNCALGQPYNPYIEDEIIFTKTADNNYFYYYNTLTTVQKKIACGSNVHPSEWHLFDGNDIYMYCGYEITSIGNQVIPPLGTLGWPSIFITKLNVQNDFNFRQTVNPSSVMNNNYNSQTDTSNNKVNEKSKAAVKALDMTLSPNPAKEILQISLQQREQKPASGFSIIISDSKGVNVIRKNTMQRVTMLNISQLKAGIYYVTVINNDGEKSTKSFLKE